ncbi:TIGR04282 family arsenosugar biosynthesis glycosyltransferase [Rhodovibrio salinarum]|uniref:Glycosyltransferase n=1 Tax=Rhodovibrio salinarum TaxID=1087 RepID=A0A934UYQ9_9PROT|nr:TIGR04282 family arsenosugar biosynthesis glycosyltransferase [Rhodovibrio salinarum]MBK1696297.1 hypothetical protein [Rhodovibrio salinarum]
MASTRHLVIFARQPQIGVGKRRLARGVGDLNAWRFQRLMLARLLHRVAGDPRWTTWLAVTPDSAAVRPTWLPRAAYGAVTAIPQGRGDLGARMARPMRTLPAGPVVIVGSDVPGIDRHHVAHAFFALGRTDAVLGPAADGGYWLIGLGPRARKRPPFDGVRWSGPYALADSCWNLGRAGLRWALLARLSDVDEATDLSPDHFR